MSEKLKPCPFCGGEAVFYDGMVYCEGNCISGGPAEGDGVEYSTWQTRPIEDALLARAEAAEADADDGRNYVHALVEGMDSDTFCDLVDAGKVDGIRAWLEGMPPEEE